MSFIEVQIDRIVGPTHHFGGLGVGNVASQMHAGQASNPRAAALQGLDKMRLIAGLSVPQLILPPQPRPDFGLLNALGFTGSPAEILQSVLNHDPMILSAAGSCSAMWTANAATVTPSCDTDGDLPVMTVANLNASLHRSIEAANTQSEMRSLFRDGIDVRAALPGGVPMRDEGAANHMRLSGPDGQPGLNVFVHGDGSPEPLRHWPRQTLATGQAIARSHGIRKNVVFHLKQHRKAIDAGAFHNDVVAMSHHDLMIHHELAFASECGEEIERLQRQFENVVQSPLRILSISSEELTLEDAIKTYFFNSQIVTTSQSGKTTWTILCPIQVQQHPLANELVQRLCAEQVFHAVHFVDLGQSMDGGGGPACLRLRVPLSEEELRSLVDAAFWTENLDSELRGVISERYPSELKLADLGDLATCQYALETQEVLAKCLGHAAENV